MTDGRSTFPWIAVALGAAHLAFVILAGRVRGEHLLADGLVMILPWLGERAATFVRLTLPIWFAGAVLDNQAYWAHLRGPIHTGDLYALEIALFAAPGGGSLPEWLTARSTPALDLASGFAYATYLFAFLGAGVTLYARDRERYATLAWAFLVANGIAAVIYLVYPAAPPWYVMEHGLGPADPAAVASPAGTARVDALLGIRYFEAFYSRSPNVFGAVPSMHVAYPAMVLLLVWRQAGAPWRAAACAYAILMCFAAVYLAHHYVLDVLAGLAVAAVAVASVDLVRARAWSTARAPRLEAAVASTKP